MANTLGSEASTGRAATWHTITECCVSKDGSGYVRVVRDGEQMHYFEFGPEPCCVNTPEGVDHHPSCPERRD